jgi:hypothetical protein
MRYRGVLSLLVLLLITACGRGATPLRQAQGTAAPKPVALEDLDNVERVTVYSSGSEEVLQGNDKRFSEVVKRLLATFPSLNLQAECVFSEGEISALKQKERLVELVFKAAERITIGQQIPEEHRERIPTDERGFRVLEVKEALFVLAGDYRGQIFLLSDGPSPAWGCWAIEKNRIIDTHWVEAVEEAF